MVEIQKLAPTLAPGVIKLGHYLKNEVFQILNPLLRLRRQTA